MNLELLRKEKKISQQDIASALGKTQGVISHWETGRSEPSINDIKALSKVLGCTIDDLLREPEAETAEG